VPRRNNARTSALVAALPHHETQRYLTIKSGEQIDMSKKFVQLMLCMVLVSVLVVSAGCAPKKGAVSPKFPEDSATATVGGQRGAGESAFGEGAGEGIGEGDLAIRQDQLVRERLFTEATQELQTIYFDYDSAVLKPEAKQKLERGAAWLKQNPTVNVQIEGHCDERGTNEYNLALGERRRKARSGRP
jgi:peptidoglycan-associated lipoprotein